MVRVLVAVGLLLCAAPHVQALELEMPGALGTLERGGPAATLNVTVSEACSTLLSSGGDANVALSFSAPDGVRVDGPRAVTLRAADCTGVWQVSGHAGYVVTVDGFLPAHSPLSIDGIARWPGAGPDSSFTRFTPGLAAQIDPPAALRAQAEPGRATRIDIPFSGRANAGVAVALRVVEPTTLQMNGIAILAAPEPFTHTRLRADGSFSGLTFLSFTPTQAAWQRTFIRVALTPLEDVPEGVQAGPPVVVTIDVSRPAPAAAAPGPAPLAFLLVAAMAAAVARRGAG